MTNLILYTLLDINNNNWVKLLQTSTKKEYKMNRKCETNWLEENKSISNKLKIWKEWSPWMEGLMSDKRQHFQFLPLRCPCVYLRHVPHSHARTTHIIVHWKLDRRHSTLALIPQLFATQNQPKKMCDCFWRKAYTWFVYKHLWWKLSYCRWFNTIGDIAAVAFEINLLIKLDFIFFVVYCCLLLLPGRCERI